MESHDLLRAEGKKEWRTFYNLKKNNLWSAMIAYVVIADEIEKKNDRKKVKMRMKKVWGKVNK